MIYYLPWHTPDRADAASRGPCPLQFLKKKLMETTKKLNALRIAYTIFYPTRRNGNAILTTNYIQRATLHVRINVQLLSSMILENIHEYLQSEIINEQLLFNKHMEHNLLLMPTMEGKIDGAYSISTIWSTFACRFIVSMYPSSIVKWKVGVSMRLRDFHFSPLLKSLHWFFWKTAKITVHFKEAIRKDQTNNRSWNILWTCMASLSHDKRLR